MNEQLIGHLSPDPVNGGYSVLIDPALLASATAAADLQSAGLLAGVFVGGLFVYSIITAIG